MKNTQKLSDLTDLQVVKNGEEVKGGTFGLIWSLFSWGSKGKGGNYGGGYGGHNSNCGH